MFILDDILLGVPFVITALRAAFKASESSDAMTVPSPAVALPPSAMPSSDASAAALAPVPVDWTRWGGARPESNPGSILAVRGLDKVTPATRQALLDAAAQLGIPVDSMALVIASESGWNATAMNPLPAAGLIQLTAGARLPGFLDASTIRSITGMDPETQIQNIVIPFYTRFGAKAQGANPGLLYMLNFLPAVAGQPEDTVLGVRADASAPSGETAESTLGHGSTLSLGTIYAQNPGFDHEKKGYFTIGDVYAKLERDAAATHGARVMPDGTVIAPDKTVAGCGQSWASFKTVGGCGNWDFPNVCGNWAPMADTYRNAEGELPSTPQTPTYASTKTVGGRGGHGAVRGGFHGHGFGHPWYSTVYDAGGTDPGVFVDPPFYFGVVALPDGTLGNAGVWTGTDTGSKLPGHVYDYQGNDLGTAVRTENGYALQPSAVVPVAAAPARPRPPGYEHAYEVQDEPDVPPMARTVGGPPGPRLGWGELFDPSDPQRHLRTVSGPAPVVVTPAQAAVIKRGIVNAVMASANEPIGWTEVTIGEYQLMLSNEPIAVQGLRLPTSLEDAIAVSHAIGALPITPAISNARWANAKQIAAKPLNDPAGALMDGAPGSAEQIIRYNAAIGPNTGEFTDGFFKDLVVVSGLQKTGRGSMAQYGFKNADGSMYEHGGPSNHNRTYKDYSDTPTYVSRQALKNGQPIDLLDEYAAGGPLGGPLPAWLIEELRGAVA